jgi:hypothetical protein
MNTRHLIPLVASLGFLGLASAQTVSPVQSAARPYDLDIAAPVMVAGSDEASKAFQTEVLPGMLKLVQSNLTEAKSLKNLSARVPVTGTRSAFPRPATVRWVRTRA